MTAEHSQFEEDTAVRRVDGGWVAPINPRWNVGNNPNGGYLLAMAVRAMAAEAGLESLAARAMSSTGRVSITAHYLSPPVEGRSRSAPRWSSRAGTFATVTAEVVQDGRERVRVLGAFGDLAARAGADAGERPAARISPHPRTA